MKTTNIALHAVLAAISTASRASAQGYVRGYVEEREDVRRETMGDEVLKSVLDKCANGSNSHNCVTCGGLIATEMDTTLTASNEGLFNIKGNTDYMEACSAVAAEYDACVGCQGYELEGKLTEDATQGIVHIPGCVNMKYQECKLLAESIKDTHPEWFPANCRIKHEKRQIASDNDLWYWNLALPINGDVSGLTEDVMSEKIAGLAGDCMVYYPWTWCVEQQENTGTIQCTKLAPFDCSEGEDGSSTCLSAQACCERIQGEGPDNMARYMYPDINGNQLQCYAWGLGTPTDGGDGGGGGGGGEDDGDSDGGCRGCKSLRLIIHVDKNYNVVLPAMITAKKDFVIQADRGIAPVFDRNNGNLDKWEDKNQPVSTKLIEMVTMNNDVWEQDPAGEVAKGSGYYDPNSSGGGQGHGGGGGGGQGNSGGGGGQGNSGGGKGQGQGNSGGGGGGGQGNSGGGKGQGQGNSGGGGGGGQGNSGGGKGQGQGNSGGGGGQGNSGGGKGQGQGNSGGGGGGGQGNSGGGKGQGQGNSGGGRLS